MKKLVLVLLLLLLAIPVWGIDFLNFPNFPSRAGSGSSFDKKYWWDTGALTFYAPFTDPDNPLRLIKGTGSLSFTRATTATYVHPTTGLITSAASGQLRIESNGALIEGQRTNLLLQSENLGAAWSTVRAIISLDVLISPSGDTTADKIIDTDVEGTHRIYQTYDSFAAGTDYVISGYLKAGGRDWFKLGFDLGTPLGVMFNLSNGTIGTEDAGYTGTITSFGNGWYRCEVKTNTAAFSGPGTVELGLASNGSPLSYVGDNTSGIYGWGLSMGSASFPSSYIPTTTAAVTRNLDSLSVASSGNIDNTAGTLYTLWTPNFANTVTASGNYYIFDAGGFEAYWNSTDDKIYLTDGTNTISTAALTFSADAAKDLAFTWGAAGLSITVDGTDTTGATYTSSVFGASIFFGADTTPANLLYGHHKNTRIWNRQFSVAERGTIAP